jgi:hypothetical protein
MKPALALGGATPQDRAESTPNPARRGAIRRRQSKDCLTSIPNPLRGCNSDLAQYSNTPTLHHSAWPDSRTRTTTRTRTKRLVSGDRMCVVESRLDVTNDATVWDGRAGRNGLTLSPLFLLRPTFPELRRTGRAVFGLVHPGLKPWAILLDHFMVKSPRPPINHQLLTADH